MLVDGFYSWFSCLWVVFTSLSAIWGTKFFTRLSLIDRLSLLYYEPRLCWYRFRFGFRLRLRNIIGWMLKLLKEWEFLFILVKLSLDLSIFCKLTPCCAKECLFKICRPILIYSWIYCRSHLVRLWTLPWLWSRVSSRLRWEADCSMLSHDTCAGS
jgi:hypothetical protein